MSKELIVEIRPGAGGDEASLFVKDMFNMYSQYAHNQGWGLKILNSTPSNVSGFKEITFELKGNDVWSKMKWEGGVHRVQRIPQTEKKGRIHTSTVTVVVLPKADPKKVKLKRSDVEIETTTSSGPGGQYTNKRETAVRVTHKKTGLVVTCQSEKSQAKNKVNAIKVLQAKLMELRRRNIAKKKSQKRLSQMGGGSRANKVRTYNFPQNRVTDHRINKSWQNLEGIIEGDLDGVIKELGKQKNS